MKKNYFAILGSILLSNFLSSQQANANINNSNVSRETLFMRSGYKSVIDTQGSPYLYQDYKKARIANNQKLVDMRYNAYKDEVDIINNGKNMTIYKKPEYSPIHIIDSDETIYLLDFPYKGKTISGYLFEVKKYDSFTVLMKISKSYEEGKYAQDSFDRDKQNSYSDLPDVFYIQKNTGEITEMPGTKKNLIKMFPDKKNKIEQMVKENKIDTRKLEVISQVLMALS